MKEDEKWLKALNHDLEFLLYNQREKVPGLVQWLIDHNPRVAALEAQVEDLKAGPDLTESEGTNPHPHVSIVFLYLNILSVSKVAIGALLENEQGTSEWVQAPWPSLVEHVTDHQAQLIQQAFKLMRGVNPPEKAARNLSPSIFVEDYQRVPEGLGVRQARKWLLTVVLT